MSSYPPVPPKRYDLIESFNALALAGKANESKPLPKPIDAKQGESFVGGFDTERFALNAMLDATKRPTHTDHSSRPLPPLPEPPTFMIMPSPQTGKHSLTMQHALKTIDTSRPSLAPPFIASPSRLQTGPLLSPGPVARPSISVGARSRPQLNITPNRPRAASVPPSPLSPSVNKNAVQCSSMTKAGKQCSRQVKLPSTHSRLDPTPVAYCHQHRDATYTAQTGFYVRRKGKEDRFVEFSHYIPRYLQRDTQLALRVEMEKAASSADVPGYIYTFEIRDSKRPDVIQLKVGRAVNLVKRLDQWDKQCGSKMQIVRGWWPGTVEDDSDDDGAKGSLLKGSIKAGEPGPLCHRVERLVHIELADLVVHTPYLKPHFPKVDNPDLSSSNSSVGSSTPKKVAMKSCPDCGIIHREIFTFPRPEKGRYKGREWELLVKPVIEKWGNFVSDYYA